MEIINREIVDISKAFHLKNLNSKMTIISQAPTPIGLDHLRLSLDESSLFKKFSNDSLLQCIGQQKDRNKDRISLGLVRCEDLPHSAGGWAEATLSNTHLGGTCSDIAQDTDP